MLTRRLLPLAVLPALALPRAGGFATTVATPTPTPRSCADPGGSFIACQALRDILPLASAGTRCPVCGGLHRAAATP